MGPICRSLAKRAHFTHGERGGGTLAVLKATSSLFFLWLWLLVLVPVADWTEIGKPTATSAQEIITHMEAAFLPRRGLGPMGSQGCKWIDFCSGKLLALQEGTYKSC